MKWSSYFLAPLPRVSVVPDLPQIPSAFVKLSFFWYLRRYLPSDNLAKLVYASSTTALRIFISSYAGLAAPSVVA